METRRQPANLENGSVAKQYAYFFPGIRGAYFGLRTVQGDLERAFGKSNATTYNSAFFAEPAHPDRYQDMAWDIKQKLAEGSVTIIAHSYGAAEAVRAVYEDQEIRENPEYRKNLKMILISPVFNKNFFDGVRNLAKFGRVMVQEARALGKVFPGKTSILGGIFSADSVPSDVVPYQSYREAARIASPKLSQRSKNEVDSVPKRDYFSLLDDQTQERIRAIDRRIAKAVEGGKKRTLRREFRRRGRDTKEIVSSILKGNYSDTFGDPPLIAPSLGTKADARAMQWQLAKESFKGKDYEMLNTLLDFGVDIWIGVAEQDLMNSEKRAIRLLRGRADRVFSTSFTTHGSPWATQPEALLASMRHCGVILSS